MAIQIPEFAVERWVNSEPLTPKGLQGRVVLLDIWEYTCINWIRTAPYVKALHRVYADLGLTVIGLHAPEFEFGKHAENIDRGILDHGLEYPIALDNDFRVWRALGNHAWPAKYLFDARGRLIDRWIGEGDYDRVEAQVRRLLSEATPTVKLPPTTPEAAGYAASGQPSYVGITEETYLGSDRRQLETFGVAGDWASFPQYVELRGDAGEIVLPFTAGEVNLVVQPPPTGPVDLTVLLDQKPIGEERGADVGQDAVVRIDKAGMTRLVNGASPDDHLLTLVSHEPGLRAYVFTFGP
jgi:hypothetical protein